MSPTFVSLVSRRGAAVLVARETEGRRLLGQVVCTTLPTTGHIFRRTGVHNLCKTCDCLLGRAGVAASPGPCLSPSTPTRRSRAAVVKEDILAETYEGISSFPVLQVTPRLVNEGKLWHRCRLFFVP